MYVREGGSGLEKNEGKELTLLEECVMIDGKVLAEVWWQGGRSWRKDGTKINNKAHFVLFPFLAVRFLACLLCSLSCVWCCGCDLL